MRRVKIQKEGESKEFYDKKGLFCRFTGIIFFNPPMRSNKR